MASFTQNRNGFYKYSGSHYNRIRKLREGKDVFNIEQKRKAMKANQNLMKEFKSLHIQKTRQQLPYGTKYIYTGGLKT